MPRSVMLHPCPRGNEEFTYPKTNRNLLLDSQITSERLEVISGKISSRGGGQRNVEGDESVIHRDWSIPVCLLANDQRTTDGGSCT